MRRITAALVVLAALAWGCGTDAESGPDPAPDPARISFLRVNERPGLKPPHGNSTVIHGPDFVVVVDSGFPMEMRGRTDVVAWLEERGIDRVDLLVGTHPHRDHIGQHARLIGSLPVDEVWLPGSSLDPGHPQARVLDEVMEAIEERGVEYREPRAGLVHTIGSLRIEVVHPHELLPWHGTGGALNYDSISMRFVYGDVRLLMTGDSPIQAEHEMLDRGHDLRSEILQLGHHGLEDSTSPELLDAVAPEVAYASSDRPSPEVVERVRGAGIDLYRRTVHGAVTIETDGRTYRIVGPRRAAA